MHSSTSNPKRPISIQSAINTALNGLRFNGGKKSFTINLKGKLVDQGVPVEEAAKTASEVSKFVASKHGEPFNLKKAADAIRHSDEYGLFEYQKKAPITVIRKKSASKKVVAAPKVKEFTRPEELAVVDDADLDGSINAKVAQLLIIGASPTTIAAVLCSKMGGGFQYVKNVKKRMMRSGNPHPSFSDSQKKLFIAWCEKELEAQRNVVASRPNLALPKWLEGVLPARNIKKH